MSTTPGFAGIIAPLTVIACILAAISYSGWFSWTENSLSDLGGRGGVAADLFNLGLIVGGTLIAILGIGLMKDMAGRSRGRMGAAAVILGGAALVVAGIFTNGSGAAKEVHLYASGLFFALLIIALLLIGSALAREQQERSLGLFIFKAGLFLFTAGAALLAGQLARGAMAFLEFLIAVGASVCYALLGARLLTKAPFRDRDGGCPIAPEGG